MSPIFIAGRSERRNKQWRTKVDFLAICPQGMRIKLGSEHVLRIQNDTTLRHFKVKCIKKLLIFLNDNLLLVPRSLKCRKMFTAFQQKKKTYKYCKCRKNKCKIIMVACWSWFPSLRTDKLGIVSHKKNKRRHLINEIFPKHLKPWKVVEWRGKN